jgi:diguanylate cyclase (GGDEF)-like protein
VTENQVLYTDIHLPGQPLRIFVQREQSIREDLLELTPYLIISLLLALAIYVVARYHLHKVHMSRTDQLTQTLNRAEFQRQVQRHLRQKDRGFALLIIDLDNFKDINDTYGHLVGDTILVETAERMKRAVRGSDLISRVGGDEFMILLLGLTEQNALNAFLKRLREMVEQDVPMGESLCLHGGLSVGYALYPREGQDFDTLYQTADQRMYEDKARRKAGR